jgi:hypothetical protein
LQRQRCWLQRCGNVVRRCWGCGICRAARPEPAMAQTPPPPASAIRASDAAAGPLGVPRRFVLTVWHSRQGGLLARAELPDGTRLDFDSPFALVRFLSDSTAPQPRSPGLR